MVGEYPLFVTPNVKSKMQKARILGKGCTCELQAEAMDVLQSGSNHLRHLRVVEKQKRLPGLPQTFRTCVLNRLSC